MLKYNVGPVLSLSFSPDGQRIIAVESDGTLKQYNLLDGHPTGTFKIQVDTPLHAVAFSPDCQMLMMVDAMDNLSLWSISGRLLHRFSGRGPVFNLVFAHDGHYVATAGTVINVWDLNDNLAVTTRDLSLGAITCATFSSDERHVAYCAQDNTITLFDTMTGTTGVALRKATERVTAIAVDPRCNCIATGHETGALTLWNGVKCDPFLCRKAHSTRVVSLAFSPDGKEIASASIDGRIILSKALSGKELFSRVGRAFRGSETISALHFSHDGKFITTAGWDGCKVVLVQGEGGAAEHKLVCEYPPCTIVRMWNAKSGEEVRHFQGLGSGLDNIITSLALSPDGKWMAQGHQDGLVKICDAVSGRTLHALRGHSKRVNSIHVSSDGSRIVTAGDDKSIRLWDPLTGEPIITLPGHERPVLVATFSHDQRSVLSLDTDGRVAVRRTIFPSSRQLSKHNGVVGPIAFSEDGQRFASGGEDGIIRVADPNTGEPICQLYQGSHAPVCDIVFSHDGRRLLSRNDEGLVSVKLWDTSDGRLIRAVDGFYKGQFGPSGRYLLTYSSEPMLCKDRNVTVWDASDGRKVATLVGHTDVIRAAVFSRDETRIVSGSEDKTIRVWEVVTGRSVATLEGSGAKVCAVAVGLNDKWILSGSADNNVRLWNSNTGQVIKVLRGHRGPITYVAFSPDGEHAVSTSTGDIASGSGSIRIWNVKSGLEVCAANGSPDSVICSRDGKTIVFSEMVWKVSTGLKRTFTERISKIGSDADVRRIIAADEAGRVILLDLTRGGNDELLEGQAGKVNRVACSADGKHFAAGCYDGRVIIWDAETYYKEDVSDK